LLWEEESVEAVLAEKPRAITTAGYAQQKPYLFSKLGTLARGRDVVDESGSVSLARGWNESNTL
jgi:hypothetical protein